MIKFTIRGEPASKANSRKIVTMGKGENKRAAVIKSEKARNYENTAMLQIPQWARQMLEGPLIVSIWIYYATERPDLDESVLLDALQARYVGKGKDRKMIQRGVYLNDRQVREKHIYHAIDKSNPRAEIIIEHRQMQQSSLLESA